MKKIYILLAEGFEEVEAVTPADVLNRVGFDTILVSTTHNLLVTGAHNIQIQCSCFIEEIILTDAIMLILPGGLPGVINLMANEKVKRTILEFCNSDKWIAAICAAPMIVGEMGLLKGKRATCYPGFEKHLLNAVVVDKVAVTDGKVITGKGIGAAMDFALEIVENLTNKEVVNELKKKMLVI